jgi:two-component system nitrogen regulation sensor histidine kinase NtrY
MTFSGDPRRRYVVLLASGVALILVLLGALQAFNTSNISFLNPDTSGATLLFTGLTGLVFLLLLLLLLLLLRNILKVYAGQGSSGLGARLRSRMVLGAVLIALTPAVFMFLFSYQLMNRSLDRWFSPNTSELREDSTRVVVELAQYVTSQRPRGGRVDCGLGRAGPPACRASGRVGRASHYAGWRICSGLWQKSAGAGQLSGSG